jgi:hypothetical protein
VAVVAASTLGFAAPALAAAPNVSITGLASGTLQAGGETALSFKVKNNNNAPTSIDVEVTFAGQIQDVMTCNGSCNFTEELPANGEKSYNATLRAGQLPAGQNRSGELRIVARAGGDSSQPATRNLTVQGPQAQATVPEVSGTVTDVYTTTPIKAAKVTIQDSGSPPNTWEVGTDDSGNFKIVSEAGKPIRPGVIAVIVQKEDIEQYTATKTAVAGQPLTGWKLTVKPLAVTPSAGASVTDPGLTPSVSSLETEQGNEFNPPDEGGVSWLLIAVGGLLVALGIGAIVLLFVKRKGDGDDGDGPPNARRGGGPPGAPGRGGPRQPQPARRGGPPDRTAVMRGPGGPGGPGHDPHRPMRPVSPGPRGADQTMIARSPLADAPTQMHRGGMGHDPYGGPAGPPPGPPPGGYGQQPTAGGGGYGGGSPASQYPGGAPNYGGQPDPYAQPGYGDQYGGRPGYGQPPPQQGQQPTYGQPYGQQPDPYAQPNNSADPRQRGGQDPRKVDWFDE